MKRLQGQSLQEYAMALGLILLIGIVALGGLGGNVASLLSGANRTLLAATGWSVPQNDALVPLNSLIPPSDSSPENPGAAPPSAEDPTTGNPSVVIPGQGSNTTSVDGLGESVEAVGIDKTTGLLASGLEDLAAQLESQGKLTPDQAAAIRTIANHGHKMAALQTTLENAVVAAGNDPKKLKDTRITYQGQEYALWDLSYEHFDFNGLRDGYQDLATPSSNAHGKYLVELSKLLSQAEDSGALADPAVRTQVGQAAHNIALIAEQLEDTTYILGACSNGSGDSRCGKVATGNPEDFDLTTHVASELTHRESQAICTAGKGKGTTSCTAAP